MKLSSLFSSRAGLLRGPEGTAKDDLGLQVRYFRHCFNFAPILEMDIIFHAPSESKPIALAIPTSQPNPPTQPNHQTSPTSHPATPSPRHPANPPTPAACPPSPPRGGGEVFLTSENQKKSLSQGLAGQRGEGKSHRTVRDPDSRPGFPKMVFGLKCETVVTFVTFVEPPF